MFAFRKDMTLVEYIGQPSKIIPLLSTLHLDDEIHISTEDANKPTMVTLYNVTKAGVDCDEQLSSL